jgi:hypothetical protein
MRDGPDGGLPSERVTDQQRREPRTEAGRRLDHAWPGNLDRLEWQETIVAIEAEARAAERSETPTDEIRRRLDALPTGRLSPNVSTDYAEGYHMAVETVRLILDVVDAESWDRALAADSRPEQREPQPTVREFTRWFLTQPRGRQADFIRSVWPKLDDLLGAVRPEEPPE